MPGTVNQRASSRYLLRTSVGFVKEKKFAVFKIYLLTKVTS